MLTEQTLQGDVGAVLGHELVVLWDLAAGREAATERCDPFGLAAQLDLFDEQLLSCTPV